MDGVAHSSPFSKEAAVACKLLVAIGAAGPDVMLAGPVGLQLEREVLLCAERYEKAKAFIPELRACFSSSRLTSLQSTADRQRWPLLNLVRQVLGAAGFSLLPWRRSDGYGPGRRKRYVRGVVVVTAAKQG